jgi:glycosyltransferase involved in cell wall biosynthesis
MYPKHHLWGIDALEHSNSFETQIVNTEELLLNGLLEKVLNKTIFKGTLGVKAELSALKTSRNSNLIYSVCGPLAIGKFIPEKIISWVFRPPTKLSKSYLNSYSEKNLRSQLGFFCLTKIAENYFSQFSSAKFIPWCVDLDLFDGKLGKAETPFFLATGKTGRDYDTLIKSSKLTKHEIRIIGPRNQKPATLPINVKWIDTSTNPPDQAIDYPTLREWYAKCTAVCIPLSGDAEDTCGYTNMLEAMAMKKTVLMTRSGSLHIDPESDGFGKLIEPKNHNGWAEAMNMLTENKNVARAFGENGRRIAEKEFSIKRFNREIVKYIQKALNEI